ncbi:hypothetical protein [Paenibacillus sp. NPDC058071]|uniref:hypothetical protein n=1 Tax=Paenibacillus sp. NPDC058071 TaxID=3346326 RepID=UPI0036DCED3C
MSPSKLWLIKLYPFVVFGFVYFVLSFFIFSDYSLFAIVLLFFIARWLRQHTFKIKVRRFMLWFNVALIGAMLLGGFYGIQFQMLNGKVYVSGWSVSLKEGAEGEDGQKEATINYTIDIVNRSKKPALITEVIPVYKGDFQGSAMPGNHRIDVNEKVQAGQTLVKSGQLRVRLDSSMQQAEEDESNVFPIQEFSVDYKKRWLFLWWS